jgi:glycine reductase
MGNKKWRAVCFINQFFGQIGGEDKASVGFSVSDKPVGPAILFNSKLNGECEVVGTIICGDNYFAENIESAVEEGVRLVRDMEADIFFAGPAFNAGRYGISCGNMASAVGKQLGIPTVTAMYPENPAVELFRKDTYIMKTKILSSDMRNIVPKMVDIGLRFLKNEHIGSAADEGYIKRDIIKNEYLDRTAAERAIDMVMKKIKGQPFVSEVLPPEFDTVEPAPAIRDMAKAKLALVTDGGLIPESNPDKLKPNGSTNWGEYNFEELLENKHFVIHSGYDGTSVLENPYRLFPKDVLVDLVNEGKLGELNDNVFVTCGNCASIDSAKGEGQAIAKRLLESKVDAAILTST